MFVEFLGGFLLLSLYPLLVEADGISSFFSVRINTAFLTNGAFLRSEGADDLMSCARLCGKEALCRFSNYDEKQEICFLAKDATADDQERYWEERKYFTGLEKVNYDIHHLKGSRRELPVLNCKELHKINPASTSGVYWIDPDAGSHDNAFKVYCDQNTNGGGWTLVWSYHFTYYSNFKDGQNAVTPRPNWPLGGNNVRVSTTPPLSETQYDAAEFSLWKKIGSDVLIKSNINNWITCKPGAGSLVEWKTGNVTCHLVKLVNSKCSAVVPYKFQMWNHGPALSASNAYYYFDGYKGSNWPTHDPCGENKPNQLTGVKNPHGNIFVR